MPLEKTLVPLPMTRPMNAGADPKAGVGPLLSQNAEYDLDGMASKRHGSERLSVGPYSGTRWLGELRDTAVVFGQHDTPVQVDVNSRSTDLSDPSGAIDVLPKGLAQSRRDAHYYCDLVTAPPIVAVAYTCKTDTTYRVQVETFDSTSGSRLAASTVYSGTGIRFGRVLKIGSALRYYYFDSSGNLYGGTINATTGAIAAATQYTVAPAASTTHLEWDICAVGSSAVAVYVKSTAGGATPTNYYKVTMVSLPGGDNSGAVTADISEADTKYVNCPACWAQSSTRVTVSYGVHSATSGDWTDDTKCCDDPGTLYLMAGVFAVSDLSTVLASTQLDSVADGFTYLQSISGVATSDTAGTAYWSIQYTAPDGTTYSDFLPAPRVRKATYTTSGAGSASLFCYRSRLACKPWQRSGTSHYIGLFVRSWCYELGTQDSVYFVDESCVVKGGTLLGVARTGDMYGGNLASTQSTTDGFDTAIQWITLTDNSLAQANVYQVGHIQVSLDAADQGPMRPCGAGSGSMLIPASTALQIDGSNCVESGFHQYAEPLYGETGDPGGSQEGGTKLYKVVYECIDGNGTRHQSSPSPEYLSVSVTGSTYLDLYIPLLAHTRKENVQIAIYRTVAGGSTFYRVASIPNEPASVGDDPYGSLVGRAMYSDGIPDTWLVDMEPLYTDAAELPNQPPFPHRIACVSGNRYFYVSRDAEATDIYYSKRFGDVDPVHHSWFLKVQCDPAGGPIKALCGFLDKLIIFKEASIYAMEGDGYDDAAGGANYTAPWRVNPSVGCADQRCVAVIPEGVVFLAGDGQLWILNHNLQCQRFSDPVAYYLDTNTPVALITEPSRALIHCMTGDECLTYNWDRKLWSVWTGRGAVSAAQVNGECWWIDSSGYLWRNSTTLYADNAVRYSMLHDTGWIHPGQFGGISRVYWLVLVGQNIASHTLRVKVAYDNEPVWIDSTTYDSSALSTFDVAEHFGSGLAETYIGQGYCLRIFLSRPCCSSFRVQVSDESGTGNTWSVTALAMVAGGKRGSMRLGKTRTV